MGKTRRRGSLSDAKAFRHNMLRQMLRPYVSSAFRRNHLIFVDDSSKNIAKIAGMRDVDVSTAILVDRTAANRLISIVKGHATNPPAPHTVLESPQPFHLMIWKDGESHKIEARIRYSICRDVKTRRLIMWHLDSASDQPITATRGADIDNDDDDEFSSSDSEVDAVEMYEDD